MVKYCEGRNWKENERNLIQLYQREQRRIKKQEEEVLFKENAERGNAKAQCEAGNAYYYGKGVTQNYQEAVKWYKSAAKQRCAEAQYNLGFCYASGKGVEKNYAEAVKWYRKAWLRKLGMEIS